MTDLKNIYDYLEKINFEKRIKEEVKFIRDRKNNPDFEIIVSPFVMTQFIFSIVRDFYGEIYKDIEEKRKNKMTDLTEQWKKGELPYAEYYIKLGGGEYTNDVWDVDGWQSFNKEGDVVAEVIAPVPSYEVYKELIDGRKLLREYIKDITNENAQLKELLKECQEKILLMDYDSIKIEILQKIDEALK